MPRPDVSKFMGIPYSISFPPKVRGGVNWGETDHSAQTIEVEDGLAHNKECEVIVHEVLHQMASLGNLGLTTDDEEKVCTFFGAALLGHIRDNPKMWRYLLQKPKA
jgi:hypothetical protein